MVINNMKKSNERAFDATVYNRTKLLTGATTEDVYVERNNINNNNDELDAESTTALPVFSQATTKHPFVIVHNEFESKFTNKPLQGINSNNATKYSNSKDELVQQACMEIGFDDLRNALLYVPNITRYHIDGW
jgi:hypothetical protein